MTTHPALRAALFVLLALAATRPFAATVTDFDTWTPVADPPHAGMSGTVDGPGQVTLVASGAVPAGTDVGFQSVNGADVAGSTAGHYFSAATSFEAAVDFGFTAAGSVGLGAIGFGLGEDGAGTDSAGVALSILNGAAFAFGGGARVGDVTQAPVALGLGASSSGRFFVGYDAPSGDVTFGVSATPGAGAPDATGVFTGIGNLWDGEDLLLSLFLRSDVLALSAGTVTAVFGDLEVLAGAPVTAVPLPPAAGLLAAGWLLVAGAGRRAGRAGTR